MKAKIEDVRGIYRYTRGKRIDAAMKNLQGVTL